jgi:hypothetical protein
VRGERRGVEKGVYGSGFTDFRQKTDFLMKYTKFCEISRNSVAFLTVKFRGIPGIFAYRIPYVLDGLTKISTLYR